MSYVSEEETNLYLETFDGNMSHYMEGYMFAKPVIDRFERRNVDLAKTLPLRLTTIGLMEMEFQRFRRLHDYASTHFEGCVREDFPDYMKSFRSKARKLVHRIRSKIHEFGWNDNQGPIQNLDDPRKMSEFALFDDKIVGLDFSELNLERHKHMQYYKPNSQTTILFSEDRMHFVSMKKKTNTIDRCYLTFFFSHR